MAKVKIGSLPEGFEIRNGKVVQTMKRGGYITGDQLTNGSYGLVTVPTSADGTELGGLPAMPTIRYSLNPVPRDEANIEAEKGETVLTDLDEDGNFELYDIGGKRHTGGGTPLNLPPQSFIFSDTAKARINKTKLADLGITSKKKMTPAKASKHFELNPYIGALADPHADKITDTSAELMLEKNKLSLSHVAFMQEEGKQFKEGVPLAAHPYLTAQGVDPIEFSMQVEEINRKEAEDAAIAQLPPEQQQKMLMLRQFMEQAEAQQAQQDQEMGMEPPPPQQQQQMQPPQGMAQGMPPQGMEQPQMAPPQMMAKCGGQPKHSLRKAQEGFETWAQQYAQTPEFQALLDSGEITMETANDYLTQKYAELNTDTDGFNNFMMEFITTPEGQALMEEAIDNGADDIQGYAEEKMRPLYDQYVASQETVDEYEEFQQDIAEANPTVDDYDWTGVSAEEQAQILQYAQENNVSVQDAFNEVGKLNETDPEIVEMMNRADEIGAESVTNPLENVDMDELEAMNAADDDLINLEQEDLQQQLVDDSRAQEATSIEDQVFQTRADAAEAQALADANIDQETAEDYTTLQDDINIKAKVSDEEKLSNLTVGEEGDYIDKIIDYELAHGKADGTGLSISSAFRLPTGATREDARKKIESQYAAGYENYPPGLRERVVDFHVNSEDPRGSLMVAAGIITPAEKGKLYTNGSFDSSKADALWKKNKDKVEAVYDEPSFIQRFDAEKHRSYQNTKRQNGKVNPAYGLTWGPRVDMWNDDFKYDTWTENQYYSLQDNGTYKPTTVITEKDETIIPEGKTIVQEDDTKQIVTPTVTKEKEIPEWKKGYNTYKEYWESDKNKSLRDASYGAYKTRANKEGVTPKSQEEFNKLWLREQQQKRYFSSLPEDQVSGEDWDNAAMYNKKDNWRYRQEIEKADADLGFTALTNDEIGHTQLAFQGLKDVHNLSEGDPTLEKLFEGSYVYHGGKKDEGYAGYKDITDFDSLGGNTWNRQYHDVKPKPEEPIIEKEKEKIKITTPPEEIVEARLPEKDFWLQDLMGVGNAISNKYRVNKYYPWAPMLNKPRMTPVFDDPTRRIAAINEQKNIADQARAMYSGPQSLAAFTGKSSGQAMKGVANLVDRVNRYNVDTANKFEGLNANMDFMTQRLNNATRTKLYDDTMRTEQNYDNAMAQADMAITRQLQNAFTNRANTYNMNTLYDQYNVDPTSGGMIDFVNPRNPYATDNRGQANREKEYFDFMNKHAKLYPDQTTSPFPAFKWVQGQNQNQNYNPQQMQMMQMMSGSPYGVPNMYNPGQNWNNQYVQPYGQGGY